MEKSADAFRTISEVAVDLAVPQHVLRFWESRFPQIRPLKRAGGRRYYRPADVALLRTIRQRLYDDGYTIKGVQRLLKEQGARAPRFDALPAPQPEWSADDASKGPASVAFDLDCGDTDADRSSLADDGPAGFDRAAVLEALACVEDCQRILGALRRPRE